LPVLKKITMKKWVPDIIYKLLRCLIRYICSRNTKKGNVTRNRTTAVKVAFMPVISRFISVLSASGEKTLWRHTVFRGGISA
jgi:hypothetical protein